MNTLSLTLLDATTKLADPVYIGVMAESTGTAGIDVVLNISSKLRVLDFIPTTLFPTCIVSSVYGVTKLVFSCLISPQSPTWAGKGLIAVIKCQPLSVGTANLKFVFTLGSTTDSNIAGVGVDLLEKVTNKNLKVI